MEETPQKSTSTDDRNRDVITAGSERHERQAFTTTYAYLLGILTYVLHRIHAFLCQPGQQRLSFQTHPAADSPDLADSPSTMQMKPSPSSMSRKSLADMRRAALCEFINSSMGEDDSAQVGDGRLLGSQLPQASTSRHGKRMSLDHTLLSQGRSRGDSSSSLGSPIAPKKTNIPSPGSGLPKSKLSTSPGQGTVTKARAPILQTELRAIRHKQTHSVDSASRPLGSGLTIKHKSRLSIEKTTSGVAHLEDLFYSPPGRKSKATPAGILHAAESSAFLQAPKQSSSPFHSPARSDVSFKTAVELMDVDVPGVCKSSDSQQNEIRPRLSSDQNVLDSRDSSSTRQRPSLQIITKGLEKLSVDENNEVERECANGVALTDFASPSSAVSEMTTSSSIDIVVDRTSELGPPSVQHKPLSYAKATPKHLREEQPVNPSPLRADAVEFVPGQAFSPTPTYQIDYSVRSPQATVTAFAVNLPDTAVSLPGIARPPYAGTTGSPSSSVSQNWLPSMPPGLTAPYRYIPSGVPSHGIIDPSRVVGLQRADWREKNPVPCDILSIDENTLQPTGYPGHTPLEWREISLAISDYKRRCTPPPIPLGVESRARFFQPGRRVTTPIAIPIRGGGSSSDTQADTVAEPPCLCGNTSLHAPKPSAVPEPPRCLHCGSSAHTLTACPQPPLFAAGAPQHVTLARYLRTAHWRARVSAAAHPPRSASSPAPAAGDDAAAFACAVCPGRHAPEEVALVVERVVAALRRAGEHPPRFDWRAFWVADFSLCPVAWALRPVDCPARLFVALNPTGNVAVRELVVAAGEALRGMARCDG